MTHGTIALIGSTNREVELLVARLEKDHYSVIPLAHEGKAAKWLRSNSAQAVLFTEKCSHRVIEQLIKTMTSSRRNRGVPAIVVAQDEVSPLVRNTAGVGEVFRLHAIPLTQAVSRLRLAIQLAQMARQLSVARPKRT